MGTTTNAPTLTEARALARRQLSYGYFRTDAMTVWQSCPLCRERVTHESWAGNSNSVQFRGLRDALAAHMAAGCES